MNTRNALRHWQSLFAFCCAGVVALLAVSSAHAQTSPPTTCERTLKADVVALDQALIYNRLGAINPAGMIYALKRDVVAIDPSKGLVAGNVQLRPGKRPRPIALRLNVGDCLQVNFTNLLAPDPANVNSFAANNAPATRTASAHVMGLQLVGTIQSDGSNVGQNPSSLATPGASATYTYIAQREGNHLLYSTAATTGGEGDGGSLAMGLFGSVNVEQKGAEWYRSQLTAEEMALATQKNADGTPKKTAGGQPILDYDAVYPAGHPREGQPILKMLDAANNIVHTDLNAVITGPNKGRFPAGTYKPNAVEPDRDQPFREFTVVYHDEIKAIQAFPQFEDPVLSHTLYSVKDGFAINYGTGGIGAEILANRLGVGPMANCTECKYEDFFLSAWAVGDPAQVVDVPANTTDGNGDLIKGAKASKVLFPDDPSNVHHSYLNDHVKMRVVHAGPKEHHIHHLHAHQWLNTPDSDNSSYLDSQAMGPGYSFTTEIAHGGSGNRNKTPGDSIFHCHFYPHFAQGMWEMWRTHDVFEEGTQLDGDGKPATGARALPDGEITAGTPIPALVPLPTIAMAPMPTAEFKGYPFYVPGVAGHRPPHPPLDTIDDGGLPRHVIVGGEAESVETRLDFSKEILVAEAKAVPETGTPDEIAAMNFHAQKQVASYRPDGTAASYALNGLPAKPGAPFADPCRDDNGNAFGNPRLYKGAAIQLDLKLNKAGWHAPQSRILTLWGDVASTLNGTRAPEPLFFRANTNDCITFQHTNLTPNNYELDDFQVRTPTDIMGQHIHLVKFDVTSSDGAGNGFNYEDGTFAPDEVIERINAINAGGGLQAFNSTTKNQLTAKAHPFFGTVGAQTTVQRWFADPTLNLAGKDRTLGTVFSHDHFGPSTHQQTGLYAGLVTEPQGSTWKHNETGATLGGRFDGGPTSWQAVIQTANAADSYREFLLEFADYTLAYKAGGGIDGAGKAVPDPANSINPPVRDEAALPVNIKKADVCPGGVPLPCPEAVSAADPGTMVVNYRNEPVALRAQDPSTNTQAAGDAGDLSNVYRSDVTRANPDLNQQPNFYPNLTGGLQPGDPFTPVMRAYEADKVQIRVLVGAHEESHNFNVHGNKWLYERTDPNSGYRNSQSMGISEHFEFELPSITAVKGDIPFADYLYQPGGSVDNQWNGTWGLLRAYNGGVGLQPDLVPLPSNSDGKATSAINGGDFSAMCPKTAPSRKLAVTAVAAKDVLPGGTLVYNNRANQGGVLHDPTAILYVRSTDIDSKTGKLKTTVPIEPLVLRANAGDCVELSLQNNLPAELADLAGWNTLPMIVEGFNANQVKPSNQVGLHPQLVAYDVSSSDGANVGMNVQNNIDPLTGQPQKQTAAPGQVVKYKWYAGDVKMNGATRVATPVEFGATNLISSDPIKHSNKGAIGSLIIEPQGATWIEDTNSRSQATVTKTDGTSFREFVLQFQTDVNLRRGDLTGDAAAVPNVAGEEDAEDSGQKALNYRTEPMWKRMGYEPDLPLEQTRGFDYTNSLSNAIVNGDPVTPVFTAKAGTPVRFRVLNSNGHARNNVFQVHGHIWQQEPYINNSTQIGNNPLSEWKGAQQGHGASNHMDVVPVNGAGGARKVAGDYLYRTQSSFQFDNGLWGIFRVTP
jgi:manganese oxidase